MRIRRFLAVLLAVIAASAWSSVRPALADSGGANDAVAINTKDDSSLFKFAFAVRHVMSDVVDQENGAAAYASCNSCQTTAIAIEIVLVAGSPSTFTPTNVALAVNQGCNLCDTFASAYQFVVQSSGPVHFTQEGLQALHDIRKEIQSWGKQGLSNAEMRKRLPDLIARLKQVLATQLVPDGKGNAKEPDSGDTTTTETQPATTPTAPAATTETGTIGTTTTTTPTDTTPTTGTDTTGTTTTTP
jgi:putative peptide zinc metalloprotease protein